MTRNELSDVLEHLAMMAPTSQPQKGWRFGNPEQLVLEFGQHFAPKALPPDVELGEKKQCFANALWLSYRRRDLIYCEGFASSFLVALHAWCVDKAGNVVDPTWSGRLAGTEYFGIPFRTRWVARLMAQKKETGVIANWEHGFPLLRHGIPQMALHRIHQPEHPDVAAAIDSWRQGWEWLKQQNEVMHEVAHVHE